MLTFDCTLPSAMHLSRDLVIQVTIFTDPKKNKKIRTNFRLFLGKRFWENYVYQWNTLLHQKLMNLNGICMHKLCLVSCFHVIISFVILFVFHVGIPLILFDFLKTAPNSFAVSA